MSTHNTLHMRHIAYSFSLLYYKIKKEKALGHSIFLVCAEIILFFSLLLLLFCFFLVNYKVYKKDQTKNTVKGISKGERKRKLVRKKKERHKIFIYYTLELVDD